MNIDEMPTGSEMNELVAKEIFGWYTANLRPGLWNPKNHDSIHYSCDEPDEVPDYSTDNTTVQEVIQYLSKQGLEVVVAEGFSGNLSACMIYEGAAYSYPPKDTFLHLAEIEEACNCWGYLCIRTQAETVPLAICRAALKAASSLRRYGRPLKEKLIRPVKSVREENLARLTRQFKPVNIEGLLSLLSAAKEQSGNLAVYVGGEPLTEGHIRIVHLLNRSIEKRLASAGLAELFGYDPNQPDVYLEIN